MIAMTETTFGSGEEHSTPELEITAEDRLLGREGMRIQKAIALAVDARNVDTINSKNEEALTGKLPFIPMECANENAAEHLLRSLSHQILPMMVTDPNSALEALLESALNVGFVSGYLMGQAGVTLSGVTIPDAGQLGDLDEEFVQRAAESAAAYRMSEAPKPCSCEDCAQARDVVGKLNDIGVDASFRKTSGDEFPVLHINKDSVNTPELERQVKEIIDGMSGEKTMIGSLGREEPPATGMYL